MASPEGVGPELEKAARPGAPSHLLGLKLGRAVAGGGGGGGTTVGGTQQPSLGGGEYGPPVSRGQRGQTHVINYLIDVPWREGQEHPWGPTHQLRYLEGSSFIGLMGAMEFTGVTGFMGFTGISSKGFT